MRCSYFMYGIGVALFCSLGSTIGDIFNRYKNCVEENDAVLDKFQTVCANVTSEALASFEEVQLSVYNACGNPNHQNLLIFSICTGIVGLVSVVIANNCLKQEDAELERKFRNHSGV